MEQEPKPKTVSAYMSVEDYEAAIAASVKQDKNGNPIPNFSVVKGAHSIQHEDGSWEFKKPQGGNEAPGREVMNQFLEELATGKPKEQE